MLRRKSKTQIAKQERSTQNAIALLNYLKCIAAQQKILRTQFFTKFVKRNVLNKTCLHLMEF
jgi:hypothetical protein